MNRKFQSGALSCLLTLLACNAAHAFEGDQHIDLATCNGALAPVTWASTVGGPIPTPINLLNSGGSVDWGTTSFSAGCEQTSAPSTSPVTGRCLANGGTPAATGQVTLTTQLGTSATAAVTFTGAITFATPGISIFGVDVKKTGNVDSCTRDFQLRINGSGGGWGDPHLTTVDGANYDFQGAGEFTALREPGLEVQTRQKPVPTNSGGHFDDNTRLKTCVALYSAVAAKLGSSRVTLQPNGGDKPSDQMELRVDGKLVTLPRNGLDLTVGGKSNGRIVQVGENMEITDAHGTRLVVTPKFWDAHQTWYLNLNVLDTTARAGTWGSIAPDSWLPALPDGSSVGGIPEGEGERYEVLYEKFADAWRVTDSTSLFDYPAGKKTADFTLDEWPRNNPKSCSLQGETAVDGTDQATAEAACSAIANPAHKKNCIFDVMVTGFPGFAEGYAAMKDLKPAPTGWGFNSGKGGSEPPKPPRNWRDLLQTWWWLFLLILLLLIILWRLLRKKSTP